MPTHTQLIDSCRDQIVSGQRKWHELPDELSADQAAQVRRQALECMTRRSLEALGQYSMDLKPARCENLIGVIQVPLGVVGPVSVQGQCTEREDLIYAPLATTEGALVASIARGCRAVREAGGAVASVEQVGMTRAPVFVCSGLEQAACFLQWVQSHFDQIRQLAEGTSRHLRLLEIKPQSLCNTIFLRFRFSCGDAMGMNMVTLACDKVVRELIEPATGVHCVALSGNYCTDKKPSAVNFIEGRGHRISAEVIVPAKILEQTLKTNSEALCEVQYRKNLLGSISAGALGYNAQFANVIASFFLATGQDLAHTAEGSLGVTCIEARENGSVYASVHLPDVPLAAIGGGTGLCTQRTALRLMGALPDPNQPGWAVCRLAEILGALVLAGELSLLAAMASHHLARAHQRLGRFSG